MEGRKSQGFKWGGGGRKGGEQLCEKEGLAVSGTKVWKVEGDGMAGTILLLMVSIGILFQIRLYLMVSWAMLGSLENKILYSLFSHLQYLENSETAKSHPMPAYSLV